jgi:Flp pilus assembly protein TadG
MDRPLRPARRRAGRRRRGDGGQASVETALVLPLIALSLLLVIHVALLVRDEVLVTHAAREAARAAAVDDDPDAARVAAERAGPLDRHRLDVRVGPRPDVGRPVRVVVRYRSPVRIPLLRGVVDAVELTARASMRVER